MTITVYKQKTINKNLKKKSWNKPKIVSRNNGDHELWNHKMQGSPVARNLLETKENIKIESHPLYLSHNLWLIFMGTKQFFFSIKTAGPKKQSFSKSPILKIFQWKFHGLIPWVNRIDWWKGHWCGSTYMVVRLFEIRSKTAKT